MLHQAIDYTLRSVAYTRRDDKKAAHRRAPFLHSVSSG